MSLIMYSLLSIYFLKTNSKINIVLHRLRKCQLKMYIYSCLRGEISINTFISHHFLIIFCYFRLITETAFELLIEKVRNVQLAFMKKEQNWAIMRRPGIRSRRCWCERRTQQTLP